MKPNNAGKDMWLGDLNADGNLKEIAYTQDADSMQALCVLYKSQLEALSQ